MERRDFLKTSISLSGSALLAGSPLMGAYASGSDVIKVALIGCGGRGIGAAYDTLNSGTPVKIVAMADAFREQIDTAYEHIAKKHADKLDVPEERKFVGFDAYKQAIGLADVVLLATSPGFRPMHFEEAIRQGKHVFMEKPVAVDIPGIRSVLATAEEAKRKKLNVVVGLQRRYQRNYITGVEQIHQGAIGEIVSGQVYWNSGGVWCRPRTPGQTEMEYQMRNWYYFTWLCGDHFVEQHIHNIDVANWAKGAYPVSAQGTGSRAWRIGKDYGEIYDNHSVEFTYADGAVIYSQARHFEGTTDRVDETLQGTKGNAYFSWDGRSILTDWKKQEVFRHPTSDSVNPYLQEHVELFAAVKNGDYKYNDTEHAAYSNLTAIIGRLASYSGHVIKWDDALKSNLSLMPETLAWDALPKVLPGEGGLYPCAIPGQTIVL